MATAMTITADEIKDLRERLKITQAELGERLGLSREAVAQWETGRNNPSGSAEKLIRQLQARTASRVA
jgi:putative transcriptional regulator